MVRHIGYALSTNMRLNVSQDLIMEPEGGHGNFSTEQVSPVFAVQ